MVSHRSQGSLSETPSHDTTSMSRHGYLSFNESLSNGLDVLSGSHSNDINDADNSNDNDDHDKDFSCSHNGCLTEQDMYHHSGSRAVEDDVILITSSDNHRHVSFSLGVLTDADFSLTPSQVHRIL